MFILWVNMHGNLYKNANDVRLTFLHFDDYGVAISPFPIFIFMFICSMEKHPVKSPQYDRQKLCNQSLIDAQ